jgi:hypothetical protein
MTSAKMIGAKHPKNAGARVPTIEGRPKTPKKARKMVDDELGDYITTKFFLHQNNFSNISYGMNIKLDIMLQNILQ